MQSNFRILFLKDLFIFHQPDFCFLSVTYITFWNTLSRKFFLHFVTMYHTSIENEYFVFGPNSG